MKNIKDVISLETKKLHPKIEDIMENGLLTIRISTHVWKDFFDILFSHHLLQFDTLCFLTASKTNTGIEIIAYLKSKIWPTNALMIRGEYTNRANAQENVSSLKEFWPYIDWMELETQRMYGVIFGDSEARNVEWDNSEKNIFSRYPSIVTGDV